ncbi:tigger transposable element-derived protein 6-like [Coccinella septempunctata]|uniref:tigger transposable element-derived protein 6-like n=1 Tax=Coccinella septempunctata TaxID=41139 RepID=UPI001D099959|nr:tigger transposable element-derived protein 6-like [Coccinella septempunctata]
MKAKRIRYLSGESASVNEDTCAEWLAHLSDLLETYTSDEIYNADETGLFYRCLPNKTLDFKNTDCHGGKESKERLTVLLAVNMSGSVKRVPCVIGKSLKPRCFKNVKTFPTEYIANSRAWMTGIIFREWLQKWYNELTKKKRALLFIDNCPAHNPLPVLISLKVEFLPPNTTSKLQPLDLGIIKNFKVKYRTEVVNHVLRQIQENRAVVPINVLEALHFIKKAWDEVSPRTIQNCLSACGFDVITTDESDTALENPEEVEIDVDCDLPVCFPPTYENIVREVQREEEDDAGFDNLEDPEIEPPTPPTVQEARQAIDTIRCFLESSEDIEYVIFRKLNEIFSVVSELEKKRFKQMKICDSFKPV